MSSSHKPKLTIGRSVDFQVVVSGRSQLAAVQEALETMREAGVPIEGEWTMGYHQGKEVKNGDPYMEADYIQVHAQWGEQT